MSVKKGGETTKLGLSGKSYGRSYGSVQKSKKETYLPHQVTSTDTLQGISLKYGVSVEQIKRANKMYTNDSIFRHSVLYIPVGNQPLPANLLENTVCSTNGSPLHNRKDQEEKTKEVSDSEIEEEEKPVQEDSLDKGMDFLDRIDRQIKIHKEEMKKVEKNSSIGEINATVPGVRAPITTSSKPTHISETPGQAESYQLGVVTVNMEAAYIKTGSERNSKSVGSTTPVLGGAGPTR